MIIVRLFGVLGGVAATVGTQPDLMGKGVVQAAQLLCEVDVGRFLGRVLNLGIGSNFKECAGNKDKIN